MDDTSNLPDAFLEDVSAEHTRRAYATDLDRFFGEETVDRTTVQSVRAEDIQSFVREMHRRGQSESTQRRRLAALRGFFDWLIQEGITTANPARNPNVQVIPSDADPSNDSVLDADEVERLIETAGESTTTGLRDQALVLTILYAALRRQEIAALEVDDIRPLGRYWVLDLNDPAGGDTYVRISQTVVDAIERVQNAYDITKGPLWRSHSNQNYGRPMTPDAIYKVVRKVSRRAGVGPVSIDTLRQTGLRLALSGGANLKQVQRHGRFQKSASAARLLNDTQAQNNLEMSAVQFIDHSANADLEAIN